MRKLQKEWKEEFDQYKSISGFEPMRLDEVKAGIITAREAWNWNVEWLEDVLAGVVNISTPMEI